MRLPILSKLTLVIVVAILSGCATPVYNYSPKSVEISEPPIDTISIAQVGDRIVRQGKYTEHDAIYVESDVTIGLIGSYTIGRGFYVLQGHDGQTGFYLPSPTDGGRISKNPIADPWKIVQAHDKPRKICMVTVFSVAVCNEQASFQMTKQPIMNTNSFQQTLIYSGRVGNRIRVGYREFSNNVARPAFNNEVEYDLLESTTIGYKGARVEILEATNEHIRYKVLRNFNVTLQ